VYGETVIIANNTEKFIEAVKSLIVEKNNTSLTAQRVKIARNNSWESRFNGISRIIEESLITAENQKIKINWRNKFDSYFFLRLSRRKIVFFAVFGFLITMYSPLFWFMGEQLVIRDAPKKSDAIVVFSGDGEVSYQNLSYQNRALDAIEIYQKGYANKIFLSSGRKQTIADVEMIKLYLVSKGVPMSSIYMLEKYPNSTYQNVIMVKQDLNKNNVSSIVFITSPYHSLRSALIWRKNAPSIDITTVSMTNRLYEDSQWGIDLNKMKVIVYEYVAIVYNWLTGRI